MLMLFATIIFYAGRKKYVRVPRTGIKKENFVSINLYALLHARKKRKNGSLLDVAKEKYSASGVEGVKSVWKVLGVFAFIPVFWALLRSKRF